MRRCSTRSETVVHVDGNDGNNEEWFFSLSDNDFITSGWCVLLLLPLTVSIRI